MFKKIVIPPSDNIDGGLFHFQMVLILGCSTLGRFWTKLKRGSSISLESGMNSVTSGAHHFDSGLDTVGLLPTVLVANSPSSVGFSKRDRIQQAFQKILWMVFETAHRSNGLR